MLMNLISPKLDSVGYPAVKMFIRFDTIPACDGWTETEML